MTRAIPRKASEIDRDLAIDADNDDRDVTSPGSPKRPETATDAIDVTVTHTITTEDAVADPATDRVRAMQQEPETRVDHVVFGAVDGISGHEATQLDRPSFQELAREVMKDRRQPRGKGERTGERAAAGKSSSATGAEDDAPTLHDRPVFTAADLRRQHELLGAPTPTPAAAPPGRTSPDRASGAGVGPSDAAEMAGDTDPTGHEPMEPPRALARLAASASGARRDDPRADRVTASLPLSPPPEPHDTVPQPRTTLPSALTPLPENATRPATLRPGRQTTRSAVHQAALAPPVDNAPTTVGPSPSGPIAEEVSASARLSPRELRARSAGERSGPDGQANSGSDNSVLPAEPRFVASSGEFGPTLDDASGSSYPTAPPGWTARPSPWVDEEPDERTSWRESWKHHKGLIVGLGCAAVAVVALIVAVVSSVLSGDGDEQEVTAVAQRAAELQDSGEHAAVIALLETADIAGDARALLTLGHAYQDLDQGGDALVRYGAAIELDPALGRDPRVVELVTAVMAIEGPGRPTAGDPSRPGSPADDRSVTGEERERAFEIVRAALGGGGSQMGEDHPLRSLLLGAASHHHDFDSRHRAIAIAEEVGLGDEFDRLRSLSLDLIQGATCIARRRAARGLRELGDKRAIEALGLAAKGRGLAPEARGNNLCLQKTARQAIQHLEALP